MSNILTVALIGAGFGGRMHAQALQTSKCAQAVTIFDTDTSRAEALASTFGIKHISRSWPEVLASDVDCVAVVTPPSSHEHLSIEALEAGKHVVCEKPLAVDSEACNRMTNAARHTGKRLLPVLNRVYMPSVEKIRSIIVDGLIGEPFLIESHGVEGPALLNHIAWLRTDPLAGVLRSQAIHPSYVLRWLFGDVTHLNAVIADKHVQSVPGDETALVTLRFASGLLAHMTATFGLGRGPSDHTFTVYGSHGYLRTSWRDGHKQATESIVAVLKDGNNDEPQKLELPDDLGEIPSMKRMWDDYAQAIAHDSAARVSADDACAAVKLIELAYLSAQNNGAPIDMATIPQTVDAS